MYASMSAISPTTPTCRASFSEAIGGIDCRAIASPLDSGPSSFYGRARFHIKAPPGIIRSRLWYRATALVQFQEKREAFFPRDCDKNEQPMNPLAGLPN